MENTIKHSFKLRLSLVENCNYSCIFCHNEGKQKFKANFIDFDEALLVVDGAYLAGVRVITFTGGEPLLYPRALELMASVKEKYPDMTVKLTSNCALLKLSDVETVAKSVDKLRINFQAADAEGHKKITKVNAWEHINLLIQEFKKYQNVHLCLNYVYNSMSYNFLEEVVNYSIKNNIELKILEVIINSWNTKFHHPINSAKDYLEKISINSKKDYQDDDLYFFENYSEKVRLCYSHCNSFDGENCKKLGELRIGPTLDSYVCMYPNSCKLSLKGLSKPEEISEALGIIDTYKGVCPHYSI